MRPAIILAAAAILAGCASKPGSQAPAQGGQPVRYCYQQKIDSIASDAIRRRAMPGCRIVAAMGGRVIFDRCYGFLDYDSIEPVSASTLYDLASVTKIAASSLALMAMYDDGLISLDLPLGQYLDGVPNNGATLRDALAHQAGFKVGVPLLTRLKDLYKQFADSASIYDTAAARQRIVATLASQPMDKPGNYLYSDYAFYMVPGLVEKFYGMDFYKFLYSRFYRPMGISPVFNPLGKVDLCDIAPTECDTAWRRRVVRGAVHDEGAAMMGGVSGHAGLFATAGDMAAIMSMLMDEGEYRGRRLIGRETVRLFTSQAFDGNRRGLVFDKPLLDASLNGTPSPRASRASFGHSGYTGTFAWADPERGLIFVFLCNRTFPSRSTMLSALNVRTQIHDIFYSGDLLEEQP